MLRRGLKVRCIMASVRRKHRDHEWPVTLSHINTHSGQTTTSYSTR